MSTTGRARAQALTAALLFSTGGAAIKACTLTSWQVVSFRSIVAAIVLFAALPAGRRFWSARALVVGAAYATTMVLFVMANKLTTAANTIFLQSTAPMYLLVLAPLVLHERVRRADGVFSAALAVGLVLFFVGTEPPQATAPNPPLGNALATVCGVTWSLTILGLRWLGRHGDAGGAESAVVAGSVVAGLVGLPLALPVASSRPTDWLIVAGLGTLQIGLAYVFLTRAVRGLPALEVSLLLLVEPVANVVWAWLVHGERPGPWAMAGCVVVLAATAARTLVARPAGAAG
jgi:drug/metabolite transporter (DMT)-like permease